MDQALGPNVKRMLNSCQHFHTDPKNNLNSTFCQTVPSRTCRVWLPALLPAGHDEIYPTMYNTFQKYIYYSILYPLRHHSPVYI